MLENTLLSHLNPRNDIKHLRAYFFGKIDESTFYSAMRPLAKLVSKPFIRGGIVGAIAGLGIGYIVGENLIEYTKNWTLLMGSLDAMQMLIRVGYERENKSKSNPMNRSTF